MLPGQGHGRNVSTTTRRRAEPGWRRMALLTLRGTARKWRGTNVGRKKKRGARPTARVLERLAGPVGRYDRLEGLQHPESLGL